MVQPYNKNLKTFSRNLRSNQTDAERLVWSKIRQKQLSGLQFYRQKPIGNYIVDFYCPKAMLVVELDGGQHYCEDGIKTDNIRDEHIKSLGIKILRFPNMDVIENLEAVLDRIFEAVTTPPLEKGVATRPKARGGGI